MRVDCSWASELKRPCFLVNFADNIEGEEEFDLYVWVCTVLKDNVRAYIEE